MFRIFGFRNEPEPVTRNEARNGIRETRKQIMKVVRERHPFLPRKARKAMTEQILQQAIANLTK